VGVKAQNTCRDDSLINRYQIAKAVCDQQDGTGMRDFSQIYNVPDIPAVYAFHSAGRGKQYVAYVGFAHHLKQRVVKHLIGRDNSNENGFSAISLNPNQLTRLEWWEHPSFDKTINMKVAAMVAFEILQPALRSRARDDNVGKLTIHDDSFVISMQELFKGPATGSVDMFSFSDALRRIDLLEKRVHQLEAKLKK